MRYVKKFVSMALIVLMLLTTACAGGLPEDAAELFSVKAWAHYAIATQKEMPDGQAMAYWQDGRGYEVALTVMRNTKSETNVLVMLEKASAKEAWCIIMRNWSAVEQGDESVPFFVFAQDGSLCMTYPNGNTATFQRKEERWVLTNLTFGTDTQVEVYSDRLVYRVQTATDHTTSQSVAGVVETGLAQFAWNRFSATVQEAQERLTTPPMIPMGDWRAYAIKQPSAYADKLPAGLQYDVYSAPDEASFRAANGRATLSTNDWVQLLGVEGDYLMVQYALNRHQYRIGYIRDDGRVDAMELNDLVWANAPAVITATTEMTDDPLNSCTGVLTLKKNAQVTYLGTLGSDWAYIETTTAQGLRIRGFVAMSDIELLADDMNG